MKQTLQNHFPRRWLLLAFVLNFAIAAAALLPYMIRDGGLLLVAADFDAEQLSYNMLCNNAIKSGEVLWNWRIDIGSDFVSSFSFYTLGSPFFWLSFLFPASAFPYLVGWIYMLKYAVAGLTSFAYFRRSASEKSALLGSVLYAFSGFSCINVVFYHFHDVIALFPLLMLGLDKRMQEGKKSSVPVCRYHQRAGQLLLLYRGSFLPGVLLYYAVSFWRRGRTPQGGSAQKCPQNSSLHPGRLSGRRHGGGTVHPLHCGGAQ